MSPYLPQIQSRDLVKVAKKLGFKEDRQKGSHLVLYREKDKSRVVIPIHSGRDIKPKTLRSIISDLKISIEEFKEQL